MYLRGGLGGQDLSQPVTLLVRATQVDNPDRYSVATLAVRRTGAAAGQLSFTRRQFQAEILENTPLNSVVLTLTVAGTSMTAKLGPVTFY